MFLFIHSLPSSSLDKKWSSFIKLFHTLCQNKNITINQDLLNAILIQTIYKHYLLHSLNHFNKHVRTSYYGFNYTCHPIHYTDITFWKICTISYNNTFYLYHKSTNALLSTSNNIFYFINL